MQLQAKLGASTAQAGRARCAVARPALAGRSTRLVARAAASPQVISRVLPYRVGHGFDLHRLAEGYKLIIGGVEIPHTKGCEAHSDGDVLLHTITDAILGALSLPDIGQLFPDNDPQWRGASSDRFVLEAVKLMQERGYAIGNLDCTIIAQKPKLSPHKGNIKNNLCRLLNADPDVINIKAKTHEKVDSIGEERSIACHAVIMLVHDNIMPPPEDSLAPKNTFGSIRSGDLDFYS
mmetsp:Transcript_28564/g.84536  ORF Transcript_28564/g.84536 Transcript_28564/m.84536 type:complete len:235 (-) Transcript_28564:1283-1987(-)